MPKLAALLLVFLGLSSAAHAESNPQWVQIQSENFTVITDAGEKQGRHIAGQFERMSAFFHHMLPGATADPGAPIIVFAFKDRKGFNAVEPAAYLAKGSMQLAGLFLRTPDKNYILVRLDAEGDHPFAIVYHEYTHYMNRKAVWMPLWLNEGLAQFFENTDISNDEVLLGQPNPQELELLGQRGLLPLDTLFRVDHSSPYYHQEDKGSVFYAESWALVHFLEVTDKQKGTHRLEDYARLLTQNKDPVSAAQQAFGDLGQLQKSLAAYISGFNGLQAFKMRVGFTANEASYKSTPLTAADADALRADILVGDDRSDDAKALLDKVLADDPKNTLAHESEGNLCMRQHDTECARKWFGEAVKLNSQSAMANYYFAIFTMQAGDTGSDAAIEVSLLSAIKSDPNFAPSYDALAHFYAMHNEKLDEAHTLFTRAIELEPQQLNYRLNASSLAMQRNQPDNAVRILEAAAALATKPDQIEMLQSRIAQIKNFQTQREKSQSSESQFSASTSDVPTGNVTSSATNAVTADGKTFTVSAAAPETPEKTWPVADASAKHHTVTGTLREVKCAYPTTLTLKLDQGAKSVPLFSANYYKVEYGAANFTPPDNLNPCTAIEGMKARIEYADVTDPDVTGQIVSIILSK